MRVSTVLLVAVALFTAPTPSSLRPHLTGHSERLAARARRGDRLARTTLVEEHMGLVRSVATRYRNLGLPVEDLVQEGAIGLLSAIDDYDPDRGATFSTYAFWRIRSSVTHALTATGRLVRVPRPVLERRRVVAAARASRLAGGHSPTVAELSQATALSSKDVEEALVPDVIVSLDQRLADGRLLGDTVPADPAHSPHAALARRDEEQALRRAVRRLDPRRRSIVSRHYGLGDNPQQLATIAADLELSPERTRALKNDALRELRSDLAAALNA